MPLAAVDMIASFSFLTHFDAISRGLLELRDLIFFVSLILLFNFTTVLIVSFKTAGTAGWLKSTSRSYYIFAFFCLLLGFAGLNLLANNLTRGISADFTEEKNLYPYRHHQKYAPLSAPADNRKTLLFPGFGRTQS